MGLFRWIHTYGLCFCCEPIYTIHTPHHQATTAPSWRTGRRARARRTACSAPPVREKETERGWFWITIRFDPSSHTAYRTNTTGYATTRPGRATPQLPEGAGIIPRAIADIFTTVRRREAAQLPPVAIYCSFVQIYNEQVGYGVLVCLTVDSPNRSTNPTISNPNPRPYSPPHTQIFDMLRDGSRGNPLVIHEDSNREIYVEGLSEFRVRTTDECVALLRIGACCLAVDG